MQYPQSLPLADKEVVLTFDDGPIPPHSNAALDILAAQCVKATFFLVGEMAREFPSVVRRIHEEGHTIGTHREHHPLRMHKMPIDKVRAEIDRGIADVGGALWDSKDLAPFFRIPGLARSDAIEKELADRSLVVFSSDTVADDWHRRIRSTDIVRLAVSRLEARGRGNLLPHDIHRTTAAALPDLLNKLKAAGFHVVHIVPGTEQPQVAGTVPARQAGSPRVAAANGPKPTAQPATAEAASTQGTTAPEPDAAPSRGAGVTMVIKPGGQRRHLPRPNTPHRQHPRDNIAGQATAEPAPEVVPRPSPAGPTRRQSRHRPTVGASRRWDRAATRERPTRQTEASGGPSLAAIRLSMPTTHGRRPEKGDGRAARRPPSSSDQAVKAPPPSPHRAIRLAPRDLDDCRAGAGGRRKKKKGRSGPPPAGPTTAPNCRRPTSAVSALTIGRGGR